MSAEIGTRVVADVDMFADVDMADVDMFVDVDRYVPS
jgi:hypothetical protein